MEDINKEIELIKEEINALEAEKEKLKDAKIAQKKSNIRKLLGFIIIMIATVAYLFFIHERPNYVRKNEEYIKHSNAISLDTPDVSTSYVDTIGESFKHNTQEESATTDENIEYNRNNILIARQVYQRFSHYLNSISEGRELKFYKIITGDLDNDGDLDAVLQYSLEPTPDDVGGDGVRHPRLLTGLIAYINTNSDFQMVDHNSEDGYAYETILTSIKDGVILLKSNNANKKLILTYNKLTSISN